MNRNNYNWNKVLLIIIVSLISAIFVLFPVIIGNAKTPDGMLYLWTGHYYLDYFYYLQFIAQGLRGYWLPRQYSAVDDPSIYLHLTPYILIGQVGKLFHLTPIVSYWAAVFLLMLILALTIFYIIQTILKEKPFYLRLGAFLIYIFAAPFYQIISDSSGLKINLYDYWSSYGTFFKRFEAVPHHLLAHILVLLTIFLCYKYLQEGGKNIKFSLLSALAIGIVLAGILTFYPFQVIPLFFAIAFSALFYLLKNLRQKKHYEAILLFLFL